MYTFVTLNEDTQITMSSRTACLLVAALKWQTSKLPMLGGSLFCLSCRSQAVEEVRSVWGIPPGKGTKGLKKKEKGQGVGRKSSRNFGEEADSISQTPFKLQLLPASPGSPVLVLEPLSST